jgi:hypothetical protein
MYKPGMFLFTCVLLTLLAACGGDQGSTTPAPTATVAPTATATTAPTPTPQPSVAYQLATIDTQSTPDGPTVAKYQTLLDSLHAKTGDSEQSISDDTVKGQQLLQGKGKNATLLALLQGVDEAITKDEHQHYADALAALITLMENQ